MFILNANTQIISGIKTKPVINAMRILGRDIEKRFKKTNEKGGIISLIADSSVETESYRLEAADDIKIYASDDLGFVYGLLYISERYLGIKPFWFWMDQKIEKTDRVEIEPNTYEPPEFAVRFRGWFFNDEVLLLKWQINGDADEPWRMAFEALLRCGGNITIPGTDKTSVKYRRMASDMGLWITHHHAEPLGAEMFARAYPDTPASYTEHPELFCKLWEDAVKAQKDYKVIWNLCFRGQGDNPFWGNDTSGRFNTPEARGALISELISKQRAIVEKYAKKPVFCTNLYGEIMELYDEGHIKLDPDIIKIYADNGFGKMVTRRRDAHAKRVKAMPVKDGGSQGIYYHVSFYDLQAANHITMLPTSVGFVNSELNEVLSNDGNDLWIINCSNVRPHVYYLDAVRKKWLGEDISDKSHGKEFADEYFGGIADAANALEIRPKYMLPYGENEDEHAGEQFYTENSRLIAHQIIADRTKACPHLNWFTGEVPLAEQIKKFSDTCKAGLDGLKEYMEICESVTSGAVFESTVLMQARIHYYCARAASELYGIFIALEEKNYKKAFMTAGECAKLFDTAQIYMRGGEYGVWEGFYYNDCFADIKHSAYMMRKLMGYIRELGDNARHDKWYRETVYAPEDRNVFLLLVLDNHMTDWELYEAMKGENI